jgi:hypothetical protein
VAFNAADLVALKDELTNDPQELGLVAPPAIDDVGNAEKLNLVRDTLQIDREAIPLSEIFVNIDRDEYAALAEADRQWLNAISTGGTINPKSGGEVREGLLQLFGAPTESRTNLLAILTEPANRIEHMFKAGLLSQGGNVTPSDVANARNAT